MKVIKNFLKRNLIIFVFGAILALIFVLLILLRPEEEKRKPSYFKKVDESIFETNNYLETPESEKNVEDEYAPQEATPENVGKPYFYGEYNPNLRDEDGYPKPPEVGSTPIGANATEEDIRLLREAEYEEYARRTRPITIRYTKDLGFQPADAATFTGSRVIFTNMSDEEIIIEQTLPIHKALMGGIRLKPGESFEFRPLINQFFSYVEKNSKNYGTIMIGDVTRPLIER